ncbi:unnamed protein product (macronuclear) [Paramecium tetraurelia]|uniref:Uncharacterized protein n=1 Tax=Paramecium tetraurelia TaxID=5888 RepID=A0BL02_PARTE|nr:uncharacterized protein GSPATT00029850001 [Paramecium tetraurelia]CAK59219.1 unnamed protein product [Paramecium tetraurelia]|eukprot:XP_001426617.1 hypothetical protein (macronuclear) [Paramecium tetraurelia strain d4-2]
MSPRNWSPTTKQTHGSDAISTDKQDFGMQKSLLIGIQLSTHFQTSVHLKINQENYTRATFNVLFIFLLCRSIVQYSNDLSLQVQVSDKVNLIIYQQHLLNNSELQVYKLCTLIDHHQSEILSVTISPCNQYIGTTSKDKTAIIFELRKNKQLVLNAHQSAVQDMIWVLQHNVVNGNSSANIQHSKQDQQESLFQSNQTSTTLKLLKYKIWTIANDGWLFGWEQGNKIYSLKTEEKVKRMHYDQNQDSLIIVSEYKLSIYQLSKKQLIRQLSLNDQIIDVKIEKAQTFLITMTKNINYQFTYYSLPNLEFVKMFIEHNPKLLIKQFDIGWHHNNLIVCCTNEGVTIMWHIQKGQLPFFRKQVLYYPINTIRFTKAPQVQLVQSL